MTAATGMTPEAVHEAFRRGDVERAFWTEHREKFRAEYPDQFVAVHDGEVVAVSEDLQRIVLLLREKGLEPTQVWVRYMAVTPRQWVL